MFPLLNMSKKNDVNTNHCKVNLKLHLQNGFHSGFWAYNRKGIGRVVKSNRQDIYFVKVISFLIYYFNLY